MEPKMRIELTTYALRVRDGHTVMELCGLRWTVGLVFTEEGKRLGQIGIATDVYGLAT